MRSRRNNTTLTRKVDKWNPRKVWLIKRYADGHYAINQEVGGRVFYSSYQRATKAQIAGIRWHYEGGRNRLADYCEVTQGRDSLEEGRKAAEAAGLPFCERLADGGDDELSPYVYDGSMALADHEKMQQAREAFEKLADALREIAAKLAEALKPVINAVLSALKKLWKVSAKAIGVPPKWLHLAAHAKKARTRKKYRNRIRRYVFEALAAEGGGGP